MDKFEKMIFDRYQDAFIPDDGAIVSAGFKKFASYIREQLNASAKMRGFSLAEFKIGHYDETSRLIFILKMA